MTEQLESKNAPEAAETDPADLISVCDAQAWSLAAGLCRTLVENQILTPELIGKLGDNLRRIAHEHRDRGETQRSEAVEEVVEWVAGLMPDA